MATISEIIAATQASMDKSGTALLEQFATVRTGRASTVLFEKIQAQAYGSLMPLNQLANIKSLDAQTIIIEPWDKSVLSAIDKAIQSSELGLTPNNDGHQLRISFPQPTEERRKELVKLCKTYAEEARVAVRTIRQKANHHLDALKSSDEGVSEDEVFRAQEQVQKLTDNAIEEIGKSLDKKEQEIMEI